MNINDTQSLQLITLLRAIIKKSGYVELLGSKKTFFYNNGRSAIFNAIKIIFKISNRKKILMPSYGCGAELEPVLRAGANVMFYRINKKMQIDKDDLFKSIDKETAAVLIAHYNGIPQINLMDIKEKLKKNNIYLIEDCASMLMRYDIESPDEGAGDISIYSIRKHLPVPDGGALVIRNPELSNINLKMVDMDKLYTLRMIRYLLKRNYAVRYQSFFKYLNKCIMNISNILKRRKKAIYEKKYKPKEYNPLSVVDNSVVSFGRFDQKISKISLKLIKEIDFNKIRKIRRKNFLLLHNEIGKIDWLNPIVEELPYNACPLFYMAEVEKPYEIYCKLIEKGIETHPYWDFYHPAVPWEEYEDAKYLKSHIIAFPVHQDLGFKEIRYMANTIKSLDF